MYQMVSSTQADDCVFLQLTTETFKKICHLQMILYLQFLLSQVHKIMVQIVYFTDFGNKQMHHHYEKSVQPSLTINVNVRAIC